MNEKKRKRKTFVFCENKIKEATKERKKNKNNKNSPGTSSMERILLTASFHMVIDVEVIKHVFKIPVRKE